MRLRQSLLLVVVGAAFARGVPACAVGGPEAAPLNPQPLPPAEEDRADNGSHAEKGSATSGGSSTGGDDIPAPLASPTAPALDGGAEGGDH